MTIDRSVPEWNELIEAVVKNDREILIVIEERNRILKDDPNYLEGYHDGYKDGYGDQQDVYEKHQLLRKKIIRLERALERFAKLEQNYRSSNGDDAVFAKGCIYVSDLRNAREALKGG